MSYSAKRILEMWAERKKRQEEKAKIKAEKDKEKKRQQKLEKRIARKKIQKKKSNAKYYAKLKKKREEYHKSIGDEKGSFSIYLMKDGKRMKFFVRKTYKVEALQEYYRILNENNDKVVYKKTCVKAKNRIKYHKYELVLVKKINEKKEDNISLIRNEEGKFIENILVDSSSHKILEKNEWLIEESFHVYGFDPQRDRKDYTFIYNNIIINKPNIYTRIMVYKNKLIHHYDDDFDMVICKSNQEAIKLYNTIEKQIDKKKHPTILFMGNLKRTSSTWIYNEIQKKTGWSDVKCCEK